MLKNLKPHDPSFIGSHYESFHREKVINFVKKIKPDVFEFYETFDLETLKPIYGVTYLKSNCKNN